MKHLLIYLFLSTLLLSCANKQSTIKFDLKSLGAIIELPGSYVNIDTTYFHNFIFNIRDSLYIKDLYKNLKNIDHEYYLIDTLNYNRFILITNIEPYAKVDSNLFWFVIEKERKISCSKPTIDSTYYYGSKIGRVGELCYIESKYCRLSTLNRKRISYNFTISSDKKSLGISFFSPEDQNVKPFINSLRKTCP